MQKERENKILICFSYHYEAQGALLLTIVQILLHFLPEKQRKNLELARYLEVKHVSVLIGPV